MDAMEDLKWFFFVLVVIVIAWIATEGYKRPATQEGPLLDPPKTIGERARGIGGKFLLVDLPAPSNNGGEERVTDSSVDSSNVGNTKTTIGSPSTISIYENKISLGTLRGSESNPEKEYIVIEASRQNKEDVNISNWRLSSGATNSSYEIKDAAKVFRLGRSISKDSIILKPGEKAIVTTGRSPVGASFKENICTGYLEQFQDFTPSLTQNCPNPKDADVPLDPHGFNDICLDYIKTLRKCKIDPNPLPANLTGECHQFVTQNFNYNSCVDNYSGSDDFENSQWRIFLSRDQEIWKKSREIIKLIDRSGNVVDLKSY